MIVPSVHDGVVALGAYEHVQRTFPTCVFEYVAEWPTLILVLYAVNTAGLSVRTEERVEPLDLGLEFIPLGLHVHEPGGVAATSAVLVAVLHCAYFS